MSYLVSISEYEQRFSNRLVRPPNPKSASHKFASDGSVKPYYGLTCIALIDQKSETFQKLCDSQQTFINELEAAGLKDYFAFLKPESFHMTMCDVNASSDSDRCFNATLIEIVQDAFQSIGAPGKIVAQLRGIGLHTTITALVKFYDERELHKVLEIEHQIKEPLQNLPAEAQQANCVQTREFSGHISLAYCVRQPEEKDAERIRVILRAYENQDLGTALFSQVTLTYFTDMNTYTPILTLNLNDGTILRHSSNIEMFKNTGSE